MPSHTRIITGQTPTGVQPLTSAVISVTLITQLEILHSSRAAAETQTPSQVHISRHREKLNVQLLLLPARKASLIISGASSGGEQIMAPETLQESREIFSEDKVFTRLNNAQKLLLVTVKKA